MANLIAEQYLRDNNPSVDFSQFSSATLSGMISAASTQVENFIEFDPSLQSITDEKVVGTVDPDFNLTIFPRVLPIASISSLKIVKGVTTIDIVLVDGNDLNRFDIPTSAGRVTYPNTLFTSESLAVLTSFPQLRTTQFYTLIDYVGGFETIPADMQFATNLFTIDMIARQSNAVGAQSIRQGGIAINYGTTNRTGDSDNIRDGKGMLIKYKRVTGI